MTDHTPSGQQAVDYDDITYRLRGIYTVPVNDGAGLLNGKDTFTREFKTPPIQHEAAAEIERLRVLVSTAAPTAPSTAEGERERLEEERNRLSNHFGYGARLDGSTRERIAAIDARLAALATPPAQMKYGEKTYGEGRDEAANFIFTGLSEALGLDGFTIQDGSETWDGDVRATLMGILRDANVIDEETNERITPPAPSVPWEEQAARWHDKKADWNKQFAAERKGTALADTALNVANRHRCYATQLRTQLRALLSKPAKGEAE